MLRLANSLPVLVSLAILGPGGLAAAPEPTLRGVERILGAEKAEAICQEELTAQTKRRMRAARKVATALAEG